MSSANWDTLKKTDVSLNVEELDGSCVKDVDLQKLYFLYVSSKPDDWKFILETRGLGKHIQNFAAVESLLGQQFSPIDIPDIDIDQLDHRFDIKRDPEEAKQRADKIRWILSPEVAEIDGVPMHLTIEQFEKALDLVLPTWIEMRRHSLLPRQKVKDANKMAMYADLLEAKTIVSAVEPLLLSVKSESIPAKVFASVDMGSVSASSAIAIQRLDGTISYVEPNKLPYRILDVYNGPVLAARIEERPGYVGIADMGSSEPIEPADGMAYDYVKGVTFDHYSRQGIVDAIGKCTSFSQLLRVLLTCGYDFGIPNFDKNPRRTTGRCWRIMQGSLVFGAIFDYPGRLGTLRWQPAATDFGQEWGMCCIYRDDTSDVFIRSWQLYQLCTSIQHFRSCLLDAEIHTAPVAYSANFVV